MTRERILIVGGGLAGLSAGCHAAKNGWDTTIVEHNLALGGVCTAWSRGEYTVDGCIHWLTGGPFLPLYEELHIIPPVEIRPLDEFLTYVDALTGIRVPITRDVARLRSGLRSIAPEDGEAIDALLAAAQDVADVQPPIESPAELATLRGRLGELWDMRHQIGTLIQFRHTVREWCGRNVRSGALRLLLSRLAPDDAPMLVVLLILGYLSRGWLSRPVGGTARFRDALVDRYTSLGGAARLNATVDEILVQGDRARGVRLGDGTILEADAVVSTASGPETVLRLLGGRYGAADMRNRLEHWKLFEPIVLISFGVAAPMNQVPSTLLIDGIAGVEVGGTHSGHFYVRVYNEGPGFAPPGHAVVQVMLPASYEWWAKRGTHYHSEKLALAHAVLAQLVEHLPAMAGAVQMIDVATPLTYWRQARSWLGAYEGWQPTREAMFAHVDKTLPGLTGFYMAGQWVEPGGGVPMAIMSGRQVIQLLCHDTGRPFVTERRV